MKGHDELKMLVIQHIDDGLLEDGATRRGFKTLQVLKHPAQALEEKLPLGCIVAILDDLSFPSPQAHPTPILPYDAPSELPKENFHSLPSWLSRTP